MKLFLLLAIGGILIYLGYAAFRFYVSLQEAKVLIEQAKPFSLNGELSERMLVLGDSTAVGVGASAPEQSLAALVAQHAGMGSVENYARSGARTHELVEQIEKAKHERYDLILIQTGGNDIIRFTSAKTASQQLENVLAQLPESEQVVVLTAGNVGGAPLFPIVLRPFYTHLNMAYHEAFERTTQARGFDYVNLYAAPGGKKIEQEPEIYLAKDGLHPSDAGYELWFEAVRPVLK